MSLRLEQVLEKQKRREILWKKIRYTLEEIAVLLCTIIGVITADAFEDMKKGGSPDIESIWKGWLNLILSCLAALMVYGTLYSKFGYNDKAKPYIIKRIATAFFIGTAWKTYMGVAE